MCAIICIVFIIQVTITRNCESNRIISIEIINRARLFPILFADCERRCWASGIFAMRKCIVMIRPNLHIYSVLFALLFLALYLRIFAFYVSPKSLNIYLFMCLLHEVQKRSFWRKIRPYTKAKRQKIRTKKHCRLGLDGISGLPKNWKKILVSKFSL